MPTAQKIIFAAVVGTDSNCYMAVAVGAKSPLRLSCKSDTDADVRLINA